MMHGKELALAIVFTVILGLCHIETVFGQDFRQIGLTLHNQKRAVHHAGPLTLDSTLNSAAATCAVYYATNKKIDHSCKQGVANAGENLWMAWGFQPDTSPPTMMQRGFDSWYNESQGYNYQSPSQSRGLYLHFTQLVWKNTTKVGFGIATVDTYTVVVGKYLPMGNMYGGGGADNMQNFRDNVLRP